MIKRLFKNFKIFLIGYPVKNPFEVKKNLELVYRHKILVDFGKNGETDFTGFAIFQFDKLSGFCNVLKCSYINTIEFEEQLNKLNKQFKYQKK